MSESEYRLFSIGHAAENKDDGTDWWLEVVCTEHTQLSDGEQNSRGQEMETSGVDAAGTAYADKTVTSVSVPAYWRAEGESNRRTCPNVQRGEELFIYTFGDTGKLFWSPRGTNSHIRRLETSTSAWNATPDGLKEGETPGEDNSYIVDVSTHRKVITITTSMRNGEMCKHTIQINPGTGIMTMQDGRQEVTMDYTENRISLINAEDVEVHLQQKDLNIKVPGDESHNVTGNLNITVTGNATVNTTGNTTVAATGSVDVTAGTEASVTAPAIGLNGNVAIVGNLEVSGFSELAGGANSPLPITAPNIK